MSAATLEHLAIRFRALISLAFVAAVWQAVAMAGFVPEKYFPAIPAVIAGFWSMLSHGELHGATFVTLSRAVVGLIGAASLGIALALMSEISPAFRRGFAPVAALIQPIPPAALVPMAVFMLGLGIKLYAFIIILVTVWPPYFNGVAALSAVPDTQIRAARMLGMSRLDILFRVRLPAALPEIFSGIRYAATIALIATIVSEMLAGHDGLGFMLIRKAFATRIPEVYALMFVVAFLGVIINGIVNQARWKLTGWQLRMSGVAA